MVIKKRVWKNLALGIGCVLIALSTMGYHIWILKNPEIGLYEGIFIEEHRAGHRYKDYLFAATNNERISFTLDVISKEDIYPDALITGDMYRIYYEKKSEIIVGIENVKK